MGRAAFLGVVTLALVTGCGGNVITGGDSGGRRDYKIVWTEAGRRDFPRGREGSVVQRDLPRGLDLTVTAGDPCVFGKCGPNLICMVNTCHATCTQPLPGCNDKVSTCGPDQACMYASDFTDACYPAPAQLGQPCNMQTAKYCVGGTLCVKVGTAQPKCLKLCKYGCAPGAQCVKTDNNCSVCLQ